MNCVGPLEHTLIEFALILFALISLSLGMEKVVSASHRMNCVGPLEHTLTEFVLILFAFIYPCSFNLEWRRFVLLMSLPVIFELM